MRSRAPLSALRFLSLSLLLISLIVLIFQLVRFSRVRASFPTGLVIAGVPVGGLNRQETTQRLLETYSQPVLLRYQKSEILLDPSTIELDIDIERMLIAAELARSGGNFWTAFWDFLWGQQTTPKAVPLRFSYSEPRLRQFLKSISERYDQPPIPALPVVGTVSFSSGSYGTELDVNRSLLPIEIALKSITNRSVELPINRLNPSLPSFVNLEVLLKQTLQLVNFEGTAGIYLLDLQNSREIHIGYKNGESINVQPDIAFSAASIIKIPVMISVYHRTENDDDEESIKLLRDMIEKSGNEVADWLIERVIDKQRGPLIVTEDMRELGIENTFLAGYFSAGSPLLALYHTPANTRDDVNTDPDIYNQTTPSDMGGLLSDIYYCSKSEGGAISALYSDRISPRDCQTMIEYLVNNRLPSLLTAGLPEGTKIAHKHGWVTDDGVITTIGDAGIIFTPGGDYVLAVFIHHPVQLVWEPASGLISELSEAVYNYFNIKQ